MAGRKGSKRVRTLPVGTPVTWHYRSAIGHGRIASIAKRGTSSANTEYKIRESDHHVSATGKREPATVKHYGRALRRSAKRK